MITESSLRLRYSRLNLILTSNYNIILIIINSGIKADFAKRRHNAHVTPIQRTLTESRNVRLARLS